MFEIITNNFWIVLIAATCANAIYFKKCSKVFVDADPSLSTGYSTLFKGYLIWMNIPWIVMGIGCTIGKVPSAWQYFNPQNGNPYVLAWFASVFLLWILGTYWLFLKGGAETLAKHPGIIQFNTLGGSKDITSPSVIKLLWCACLLGGILGMAIMWTQDIPIPK